MKGWRDLGVVDTIYEEDDYQHSSSTSSSLSPSPVSSPHTPLHSRVESWSRATGRKPDVLIRVMGTCFHLHKDPLSSRSLYLQRHLTDVQLILSPPLNITPETFSVIVGFCYGNQIVITPFNVAVLRTASELLEMTEVDDDFDENLVHLTETYFRQVVVVNHEYALIVFRSCLDILPEAETTAFLVSRCFEALTLDEEGDDVLMILNDVKNISPEDFQIIVESIHNHDLVYRLIDLYLKEPNGKITEEHRTQICNSIDCNKLSPKLLVHAVQNPRLPLRFIVRAMLTEQLNTRRSIVSTIATTDNQHLSRRRRQQMISKDPVTLGAILQRDAALRQVAQLKAAMEATNTRIQSVENELSDMKKLLSESEKESSSSALMTGRSASFHYGSLNKIECGLGGSGSSASFRFSDGRDVVAAGGSSCSGGNIDDSPRVVHKNIRQRLFNGLKNAFKVKI